MGKKILIVSVLLYLIVVVLGNIKRDSQLKKFDRICQEMQDIKDVSKVQLLGSWELTFTFYMETKGVFGYRTHVAQHSDTVVIRKKNEQCEIEGFDIACVIDRKAFTKYMTLFMDTMIVSMKFEDAEYFDAESMLAHFKRGFVFTPSLECSALAFSPWQGGMLCTAREHLGIKSNPFGKVNMKILATYKKNKPSG